MTTTRPRVMFNFNLTARRGRLLAPSAPARRPAGHDLEPAAIFAASVRFCALEIGYAWCVARVLLDARRTHSLLAATFQQVSSLVLPMCNYELLPGAFIFPKVICTHTLQV
jgi:hypothetical protein